MVTPQAVADAMVAHGEMIQQFRIVQDHETHMSVFIVRGRDFTAETVALVEQGLRAIVGSDVELTTDIVAGIDRDSSGKQRSIISHIAQC